MLPSDPYILLSVVNTKLRDFYPSIEELCKALDINIDDLSGRLEKAGFSYDRATNQFR